MTKRLKNCFHSPKSFLEHGIYEKNTWIAIGLLIFGIIFKDDIYYLIHSIFHNSKTTDLLITQSVAIVAFVFAWFKEKK